MMVANGYGKHRKEVSDEEFMGIQKVGSPGGSGSVFALTGSFQWLYTASLLYIIGISFSKLSLAEFIRNLSPSRRDRFLARTAEAVTVVWAVVAFFGTAFQCAVPQTWNLQSGKCLNQVISTDRIFANKKLINPPR